MTTPIQSICTPPAIVHAGLRLGLDWDGTISCYAPELALLARIATHVVVITLNDEITTERANHALGIGVEKIVVCICPEDRIDDYPAWKAQMCRSHAIQLMIDDDHFVAKACWSAGIPALLVRERDFEESEVLASAGRAEGSQKIEQAE